MRSNAVRYERRLRSQRQLGIAQRILSCEPRGSTIAIMRSPRPPWVNRQEQSGGVDARSPDERLRHFVQACELARTILEGREDAAEVLARQEPMSPKAAADWQRLVSEARRARKAG